MRSEEKMMELILNTANQDERIRAAYMNGSKVNPTIEKDVYQDYDIVYAVTDIIPFIKDRRWLTVFGDTFMVQEPDDPEMFGGESYDRMDKYTWLMLFDDGNRIDLTVQTLKKAQSEVTTDKLTVLLLDKDGLLPQLMPPTDRDYHVKKPSEREYLACCNEFWWCLNNVAKGIARDELPYAMQMYNCNVRDMLDRMVEWQIGINTEFTASAGKMGKFYKKYLSDELYCLYAQTYSTSDYEQLWESVLTECSLFRKIAITVADVFGYKYNQNDDKNMMQYITNVRNRVYE